MDDRICFRFGMSKHLEIFISALSAGKNNIVDVSVPEYARWIGWRIHSLNPIGHFSIPLIVSHKKEGGRHPQL